MLPKDTKGSIRHGFTDRYSARCRQRHALAGAVFVGDVPCARDARSTLRATALTAPSSALALRAPWLARCWAWCRSAAFRQWRPRCTPVASRRLGTLVAVFLSTSDEMLPLLLAEQVPVQTMAMLLASKALIALVTGFIVDAAIRGLRRNARAHAAIRRTVLGTAAQSGSCELRARRPQLAVTSSTRWPRRA